jgi:hypothetical protein
MPAKRQRAMRSHSLPSMDSASRDIFFLLFSVAFAIYAGNQLMLGWVGTSEFEPLYYLPRQASFGLIVVAVINKNRSNTSRQAVPLEAMPRAIGSAGNTRNVRALSLDDFSSVAAK